MHFRESFVERQRDEVVVALLMISALWLLQKDGKISKDTEFIIGVLTATLGVSVAILKAYFLKIGRELSQRHRHIESKTGAIATILEGLGHSDFEFKRAKHIVDSAVERISLIPRGKLALDASAYFDEVLQATRSTMKGCEICAVNSINILRWIQDPHQDTYLRLNFAAVERGVHIHRIFVLDKPDTMAQQSAIRQTIRLQKEHKIMV